MGAFLARILALIIPALIHEFVADIGQWYRDWDVRRKERQAIREKNRQAREQTEAAQTKEERDRAADNIRNRIGS